MAVHFDVTLGRFTRVMRRMQMMPIGSMRMMRHGLVFASTMVLGRFAMVLARGLHWLTIQTENSNYRLQSDLAALKKWAEKDWPLIEENLFIHTIETDADSLLYLSDPDNIRRLEAIIRKFNPDIVGFDPLRDFGIGDLNSDGDMAATLRELGRISRAGNPKRSSVVLHHSLTGRAGTAKAFGLERTGFGRNSKVLQTWARGFINVVPGAEDDNETLIIVCGKNSNGKEFSPIAVRLNPDTMIYEANDHFDIDSWRQEIGSPAGTASVKPPMLRELLQKGREYDKAQIVAIIRDETGVGKTRAYELVDQAKSRRILNFNRTIKTYALA